MKKRHNSEFFAELRDHDHLGHKEIVTSVIFGHDAGEAKTNGAAAKVGEVFHEGEFEVGQEEDGGVAGVENEGGLVAGADDAAVLFDDAFALADQDGGSAGGSGGGRSGRPGGGFGLG